MENIESHDPIGGPFKWRLGLKQGSQNKIEGESTVGDRVADFKIIGELGRGTYGVVYKVISNIDKCVYVMKKINIKHVKQKHQAEALKEAQILSKVHHNNIIRYYNSFVEENHLYIIMEFAEGGDLHVLLRKHRDRKEFIKERDIWSYAWELCHAIEYLHNNNIIHRDIKTLNIFLSKDNKIKVGDLGVSKIVSDAAALQGTRVGTPLYLAPELVKQEPYDYKVDVWAIGCVLYHIVALEPPFQGENLISLGFNIINKPPKPLPKIYSTRLSTLISKLLEKLPSERPKIADLYCLFPSKYQSLSDKPLMTNESSGETTTKGNSEEDPVQSVRRNETEHNQGEILSSELDSKEKNQKEMAAISQEQALSNVEKIKIPEGISQSSFSPSKAQEEISNEKAGLKQSIQEIQNTSIMKVGISANTNRKGVGNNDQITQQNDKGRQKTSSQENLTQSTRLIKQSFAIKKSSEKATEIEETVENKLRGSVGNVGDSQGNESTLCEKKPDQTKSKQSKPKEDVQKGPLESKAVTPLILEKKPHRSSSVEVLENPRSSGEILRIRQPLVIKKTSSEPQDVNLIPPTRPNTVSSVGQGVKKSVSQDLKKSMMNPLIKSTSPRASLAHTKFAEIISLRNDTNLNIMKASAPKRLFSGNIQPEYRVRPVSAHLNKRQEWDEKPTASGNNDNVDTRTHFVKRESVNEIIPIGKAIDSSNRNDQAVNLRPKSAAISRSIVVRNEVPYTKMGQKHENHSVNLKLRDLIKINSDPKSEIVSYRSIETLNTQETPGQSKSASVKNLASQQKLASIITQSSRDRIKSDTDRNKPLIWNKPRCKSNHLLTYASSNNCIDTNSSMELGTQRKCSLQPSEDFANVKHQIEKQAIEAANFKINDVFLPVKPASQSSAGFFLPRNKSVSDVSQLKDNSTIGLISKGASARQNKPNGIVTNFTPFSQLQHLVRPITSSDVRKKYTIKDFEKV